MDNIATVPTPRITEEEYPRLERAAKTKSEFVDGEMFAMSGGTRAYSLLAGSWIRILGNQLLERNYTVFNSELRIRTRRTRAYVCPDVSVVCEEPQANRNTEDLLTNPTVVIEVLSPSNKKYDRGRKFELYREIPSLRDYLLVHSDAVLVEQHSRQPENWLFREYSGVDSSRHIESIDCTVALEDVYRSVF